MKKLSRLLAVVADVDAGGVLCRDHVCGGLLDGRSELLRVDGLAAASSSVHLGQGLGAGEAPGVSGQDPVLAGEHGPMMPAGRLRRPAARIGVPLLSGETMQDAAHEQVDRGRHS